MPKIGEIYTTGSDKSHLCTQHAQNLPRNFSCTASIAPPPPPPTGPAAESPQVSTWKFLATATRPDHSMLRPSRKAVGHGWKWWFCYCSLLSGKKISFFWESNLQILGVFNKYYLSYISLFESPKTSCIACPHALQIQITFYPFIMIKNQIDQILTICSER